MTIYYIEQEDVTKQIYTLVNVENLEIVTTLDSKEELFNYIFKEKKSNIYYIHDLKNTINVYIADLLTSLGYTYAPNYGESSKLNSKQWQRLSTLKGEVYNIKIRKTKNIQHKLYDSKKLLPYPKSKLTENLRKDMQYANLAEILVIPTYLKKFLNDGHNKMTISSNAFAEFLNIEFNGNFMGFRKYYPELSIEEDDYIREAYRGGWCYVNNAYIDKRNKGVKGITLDVNSLFPAVMLHCALPWGKPKYFKGKYEKKNGDSMSLYLQRIRIFDSYVKDGYVPFIQDKATHTTFDDIEYLEITLTNMELELFLEAYETRKIEYVDGYKFFASKGIFNRYINKYRELKVNATTEVDRQLAKLFLNSLYGKFGTEIKRDVINYKPTDNYTEEKESLGKYYSRMYYTALSVFISAYAKVFTVKGAIANIDRFVYADTDSLHLFGTLEDVKGLKIDANKFGFWKLEKEWNDSKFLGQKSYIEGDLETNNYKVVCAGLPREYHHLINNPEDFRDGKQIFFKQKTKVNGQITFVTQSFIIRANPLAFN